MMTRAGWKRSSVAARRPAYLAGDVAQSEARRQRALVVGLIALSVLSIAPLFAHHVEQLGGNSFMRASDLGGVCLVALHELLAPVHTLFHVALVAGLAYATLDRFARARVANRTLASLRAETPTVGEAWWSLAVEAGCDPRVLRIVGGLPNPAFTVGWLRPRIYLAAELADHLPPDELRAVIAHEWAHVQRRDPLRLSLYQFIASVFFWIPAVGRLADDVADETEVRADDAAAASRGGVTPTALASALVSVATWMAASGSHRSGAARQLPETVGFASGGLLDRRVRRLTGGTVRGKSHLTGRATTAAAVTLMLVWASGVIVAHPLHAQNIRIATAARMGKASGGDAMATMATMATMDCSRHKGLPLFHILCPETPANCPHAL